MLISLQRKSRDIGLGQKFFRYWSRRANSSLSHSDSFDKGKNTVINVEEAQKGNEISSAEKAAALNDALTQALNPVSKQTSNNTKQTGSKPTKSIGTKNTPRKSPSLPKKDSFSGPNVRSSDSRPESSGDIVKSAASTQRSMAGISINLQNGNKSKKVTFQDDVKMQE